MTTNADSIQDYCKEKIDFKFLIKVEKKQRF